ncbi:VWA domain-containing protein [Frankia sp. AgB1.9]|uniref:vWA domain-containing protein n=1 Tax=unclassified Frankia TaxID=2632575 RepID=UPI0019332449|nr:MULTISPECIES: vWA domain-containing protein [unclassified Frankia]MBL7488147.1 VWA domain-containing protein [Frankia sp. AgW1.1]MBL7552859.1 VWA domain-containing protein [Frankia sp. AgB1.9]MBL7620150.1 VWA domain-containing protein [Frankia sp. AgB1.8]
MYERTFSRTNPGCIVFLLDRSDSMKKPWQSSGGTLAEGATRAVNKVLLDLCVKSAKEVGGRARHYFDVGVFGYGARPVAGGEGVEPALGGQPIVPIPQVFDHPLRVEADTSIDAVAGSKLPVWVEPVFGYRTPMCEAIATAGEHVFTWAESHPDSFPPIVINITDGMVTDSPFNGAGLAEWASRLTSIETRDGRALLFNIFLSPTVAPEVLFPAAADGLPEPGPELFAISSVLPPSMVANARGARLEIADAARGFVFNAGLATLMWFLEIGTRVADVRDR